MIRKGFRVCADKPDIEKNRGAAAQLRVCGRSNAITANITPQPTSGTSSPMRKLPEYRETTPTNVGMVEAPPAATANITPPTLRARAPNHLESHAM